MKNKNIHPKIKEVLIKGVGNIYPNRELLERKLISGQKIRLYCGYDPSTPSLHLGHMATLLKLSQFQELGHEVIMLIGDFTGMIGDPTDKLNVRKKLTRKEVLSNAKNYKKLASNILNFTGANPVKVFYNSRWNDKLSFLNLIEMASNFTVQQIIIRDMFQERIKRKKPIYLHEFLYPLAQAYDSVAMDVNLEIGGEDQTFNMLCGRDLLRTLKNKEKFVLTLKLLTDPIGKKMGKTEGNIIPMDAKPEEMFGKIMSWPDSIVGIGFELLTKLSMEDIKEIFKMIEKKKINLRDAKARLAKEIVAICHNKKLAIRAGNEFDLIFREKKLPTKIPEIKIDKKNIGILELLVKVKLASSKSDAKRLVLQKGVKIGGEIQTDWKKNIEIKREMVIQVGKRKFAKIA